MTAKSEIRNLASDFVRNKIRPHLPRKISRYNDVTVSHHRWGDRLLPAEQPFDDSYKENLIEAVKKSVQTGDTVVVVGGGYGVTATHAWRELTETIHRVAKRELTVFECSDERHKICQDVFELNNVDADLRKQAVGDVRKEVGTVEESNRVQPSDLPECDVLILDCEGAESKILENMSIRPREVVVETHAQFNSSTERVEGIFSDILYDVVAKRPDAPYTPDNVLTAKSIRGDGDGM